MRVGNRVSSLPGLLAKIRLVDKNSRVTCRYGVEALVKDKWKICLKERTGAIPNLALLSHTPHSPGSPGRKHQAQTWFPAL